jgi:glycosyltransferase involved in cell wall biosynthesis
MLKLSIVIPCYNSHEYLNEALESAINQTYENKEIIIVNDGSGEKTLNFLDTINEPIVKIIHQENKGLSSARNFGAKESDGEYILFLDADDKFDKTFAEKAINILSYHKDIGIVTCWMKTFNGNKILKESRPLGGNQQDFLFQTRAIASSMVRKSIWSNVNGYDESMLTGMEDWEFYIRATEHCNVKTIEEFLFFYRDTGPSLSTITKSKEEEIRRYIMLKHKELYINNYELLINELLLRESKIKKIKNKIEFRLGKMLLQPLRFLKYNLFRN